MTAITERYVPCEACELEVPRRLAVVEPQGGGHLCQGCVRALRDMVENGSDEVPK